jgi:hypothetical protein
MNSILLATTVRFILPVSLWRTKDDQLICHRCGREILEVTDDGRIVAIKGKDFPGPTKKSTSEQIQR